MRLWHKDLIPVLPRQQLLGQWRECCLIAKNIAEKGTPNHVLVNRVMEYPIEHFICYSALVACEMEMRGYRVDVSRIKKWIHIKLPVRENQKYIFAGWHNDRYLRQCLYNLQEKYDTGAIPDDEWKRIVDKYPWIE